MISAVILTRNEENNIADCIESVKWCDEVIVIDDNSEDKTVGIAGKERVEILKENLNSNFSKQRNLGIDKAKGDWILFVDADERVTDSLRYEIQSVISDPLNYCSGFMVKRKDFIWNKQLRYGETAGANFLRLAKKHSGRWEGRVHEKWKIRGKIGKLNNYIAHFPHQTLEQFLEEVNLYTDIRSKELYDKGVKTNLFLIIAYPKVKFFINYIIRRGFLDGLPGLVFATVMSFHSFLVRAKLWMLWQKK